MFVDYIETEATVTFIDNTGKEEVLNKETQKEAIELLKKEVDTFKGTVAPVVAPEPAPVVEAPVETPPVVETLNDPKEPTPSETSVIPSEASSEKSEVSDGAVA